MEQTQNESGFSVALIVNRTEPSATGESSSEGPNP